MIPTEARQSRFTIEEGALVDLGDFEKVEIIPEGYWPDGRKKSLHIRIDEAYYGPIFRRGERVLDVDLEEEYLVCREKICNFFAPYLRAEELQKFKDSTQRYEVVTFPHALVESGSKLYSKSPTRGLDYKTLAATQIAAWEKDGPRGVIILFNIELFFNDFAENLLHTAQEVFTENEIPQDSKEAADFFKLLLRIHISRFIIHELLHHFICQVRKVPMNAYEQHDKLEDELIKFESVIRRGGSELTEAEILAFLGK